MYEFWYDYIKSQCQDNSKLCYIDTESFIIHIKTEDVYEDIANDVKKDLIHYEVNRPLLTDEVNRPLLTDEVNRPLLTGKNKKVIGLMKDKLGGKIMTEFAALRPKHMFLFNG